MPKERIEFLEELAEKFDGDKALFWAGQMSDAAGALLVSSLPYIGKHARLLDHCRKRYDDEIVAAMEKKRAN